MRLSKVSGLFLQFFGIQATKVIGEDNGEIYIEKAFASEDFYSRQISIIGNPPFMIVLNSELPTQISYTDALSGVRNCQPFNAFVTDEFCTTISTDLPNDVISLSNVNSNKIDIIFQNPEDIILDVPLSITDFIDESFETFIRSGNLTSKEERKAKGTEKYAVNLKSILSVSFSVILTTVADGRSLHFGMYEDLKVVLEEFFTIESVQQVQIVDIRPDDDKTIFDCTFGMFLDSLSYLERFNSSDLIEAIEFRMATEANLTPLIHTVNTGKTIIPFAIIVSVCSLLIISALVVFCVIGVKNGKTKGELAAGWFLSVFRPTILVMAETLIWQKYCNQHQIIYPSVGSFGIGFIIIVLFGFGTSCFKTTSFIYRIHHGEKWVLPWSPGNLPTIVGILTHDLPVTFLVYFYYTKYYSVLSSFQLTIMVFQGAHLTLVLKQITEQRKVNMELRKNDNFWFGNFLTILFFFFSLVTIILMFSRTVALQVAKLSILNGSYATKSTMRFFTPDYRSFEGVYDKNCMKTLQGADGMFYNSPSPFDSRCLNSVEIGIITMFGICYSGVFLFAIYAYQFKKTGSADKYAMKPQLKKQNSRDIMTINASSVTAA